MNKVLIVHTSWYEDYIKQMINTSSEVLAGKFNLSFACAPGAIELAALEGIDWRYESSSKTAWPGRWRAAMSDPPSSL